jgi:hypothetical protein
LLKGVLKKRMRLFTRLTPTKQRQGTKLEDISDDTSDDNSDDYRQVEDV